MAVETDKLADEISLNPRPTYACRLAFLLTHQQHEGERRHPLRVDGCCDWLCFIHNATLRCMALWSCVLALALAASQESDRLDSVGCKLSGENGLRVTPRRELNPQAQTSAGVVSWRLADRQISLWSAGSSPHTPPPRRRVYLGALLIVLDTRTLRLAPHAAIQLGVNIWIQG